MALGKWYGCLLMAVCLFAIIDSVQPQRNETRQVNRLVGPDDSLNLVGTNASFICVSPLRSCLSMDWYKEVRTSTSRPRFSLINRLEVSVRARIIVKNTTSGCKLTLRNVRTTDSGTIYCQLYAGRNAIRGRQAKLTAITQRYALRGMANNASYVGDDVDFTCISPLRNCVGLSWHKYLRPRDYVIIFSAQEGNFLKDKYVLKNSTFGCRLTIRNLDLTDNGGYICKIEISQRPVEISANLYVFVPLNRPENLMSLVGRNTIFSCVSPLRSCVNMTWSREGTLSGRTYFFLLRTYRSATRAKYIVENTTVGCELTIRNVQLNDTGSYRCELRIGGRLFEGSVVSLKVTTQEDALRGPSDGMHIAGRNTSLTCLSPFGNCRGMSWYKDTPGTDRVAIYSEQNGIYLRDKYIVTNSTDGCRLTIKNLDLRDTGSVYCQIQISGTAVEKSATLIIFQRQIENPLIGPDDDTLSFIDATAVFTCLSPLRGCAKINWYKHTRTSHTQTVLVAVNDPQSPLIDRYVLDNGTRLCKLIISNVRLNDAGYYTCKIVLGSTSFQGKNALLTVITQEDALRGPSDGMHIAGQNTSLTCLSPLGDCRGMSWYKELPYTDRVDIYSEQNGIYLRDKYIVENSTDGCRLSIKKLDLRDTGSVYCQIQVSRRAVEKSATLIIFQRQIENPLIGPDDDTLSFINATAVFACLSPLRSCAKINWYKHTPRTHTQFVLVAVNDPQSPLRDRYVLDNGTRLCKLIISNVRLNDAGYYTCKIVIGSTSFQGKNALLTVINAPQPRENPLRLANNFSTPGSDVSLTCVSPSRSCTGINWVKGYVTYIYKEGNVVYRRGKYLVDDSASGCELIIKSADKDDISEMFCRIEISQISYLASAVLIVFETKSQKFSLSSVGANATFTCDSPLGDCENMTWFIDDLPSISGPPVFVPVYDVGSTVRDRWTVQKTSSGCKLTLINVQLTDAGHVYCEIMLGGRPIRGETTNFTVFSVTDHETIG